MLSVPGQRSKDRSKTRWEDVVLRDMKKVSEDDARDRAKWS